MTRARVQQSDSKDRAAVRAYATIRELIIDGRLAPGSRVVETELAERLGLSRTPVRGALQRLEQEGLVLGSANGRQSRAIVAPLTRDDARELFEIIGALEAMAGRLAAQLPDPARKALVKELDRLNRELSRLSKSKDPDPDLRFRNDTEFHRLYVDSAGGARLRALHASVRPQADRYVRLYISLLVREIGPSHDEHQVIAAAIARGDANAADKAIQTNWRNAADRLTRVMERAGERGVW